MRLFSYESADKSSALPLKNYRINFYFTALGTAIAKIEEKFKLMTDHNDTFPFLNIFSQKVFNRDTKIKYCMDFEMKLSDNAIDLCDEIEILLTQPKPDLNALAVSEYIVTNDLTAIFPNVIIALRIFLTIRATGIWLFQA